MRAESHVASEPRDRIQAILIGCAAGAVVLCAWFVPVWIVPIVGALFLAGLLFADVRGSLTWPGLGVAALVLVTLFAKDRFTSGPLGQAAIDLGAVLPFPVRQPDVALGVIQLAAIGMCFLLLPTLRAVLAKDGIVLAWMRGVVSVMASLAAVLLTAPRAVADYDATFHLGAVLSRNAASCAFALGAILAAGLALAAIRDGRTREWPVAILAMLLCVVAVAGLGSRGGLLALLVGTVFGLSRIEGRRVWWWIIAVGALALGALLIAPTTVARLADLGREYRLELWAASFRALWHAPIGGMGCGGFEAAFALFGGFVPGEGMRVVHPDSSWVQMLVEWGAGGVLVLGWAGWRLLRGQAGLRDQSLRIAAEAGVVAWMTAAIGDVSFHRAALVVVGLPLLAIIRPATEGCCTGEKRKGATVASVFVVLLLVVASVWANHVHRRADDPALVNAELAQLMPLDVRVNHVLGREALARGEAEKAAVYFGLVAAVDRTNVAALGSYARALMPDHPELALPLWKQFFRVAHPQKVAAFFSQELEHEGGSDVKYWMRAVSDVPELWVILADSDRIGAQRCYGQWRLTAKEVRARSAVRSVLGAMARWGRSDELADWLGAAPPQPVAEGAAGARLLLARGRSDLAWVWLAHLFPAPPPVGANEVDAGLKARVTANPSDYVAAVRLLDQMPAGPEALKLLHLLADRPGSPVGFRIRLAHELRKIGRREEALEIMLGVAETITVTAERARDS